MLGVHVRDDVSPGQHRKDLLGDASVNGGSILGVPDNEGIVAANSCEVAIVRTEREL